jgi:hypothetical protein
VSRAPLKVELKLSRTEIRLPICDGLHMCSAAYLSCDSHVTATCRHECQMQMQRSSYTTQVAADTGSCAPDAKASAVLPYGTSVAHHITSQHLWLHPDIRAHYHSNHSSECTDAGTGV